MSDLQIDGEFRPFSGTLLCGVQNRFTALGRRLWAQRHITTATTFRILCGVPHKMREICTSGLMSGERKRSASQRAPPRLSSTLLKRQKNDAADAEAICEAAQRLTMRFVAVKSEAAQGAAVVFRTRDMLVRQRTQIINALRGHLAEFGLIVAQGPARVANTSPR